MHRTDKYSQHSSIIWPVWLSGLGFESSSRMLNPWIWSGKDRNIRRDSQILVNITLGNEKWATCPSKRTKNLVSWGIGSFDQQISFKHITSFPSSPIHAYLLFDGVQNVSNKSWSGLSRNILAKFALTMFQVSRFGRESPKLSRRWNFSDEIKF